MEQPPTQITVSQARDDLRSLVEHVAATGSRVRLTHYGKPAGVLIGLDDNQRNLQMSLGGAHGVADVVTRWAAVREAARFHPQALVLPSQGMAVLLGPELEQRLDHGHPPLPAEITFDGETITGPDGTPLPAGTYAAGETVLTISSDEVDGRA